ncbi:good for full DBP5 activity protein 2 [Colletotrichum spaethianum]|uniref:Good for full DBP5 activity protein 2 n=1 Tax=Colletotrichum spaethianum TaxID=700344 RepID=A0AA37P0U6_9PEZI|nr:good for full DBP5 activity protein 2 [Colletotrichum spaethianum]GKT44033.1 good for full DBP5 activity protein 2 [Colletotrichum spaethianum]
MALTQAQQIERLIQAFGDKIRFEEGPHQEVEEAPETIVLDPLALDRQIAAKKAATKGKSITMPTLHYVGPPLEPSKSEKLAPADFNALVSQDFPEFKSLKAGDLSEEGMTFVSWDLVQRYSTSFIGKTNRPKAQPFFDDMTEEQTWDFFYVYHPQALDRTPYIFVPTKQFQHFLDVVNASIQTRLAIPLGKPGEMFYITFGSSCTIRPKYIARSASHSEYRALRNAVPPPEKDDALADATTFGKEMLLSLLNIHNNYKGANTKNKKKKQEKAQYRDESLYDAQLFLGLRPKASEIAEKEKEVALDQPAPHTRDQDVVFVCIDIEVAEEHHGTVLEIGLSTLDTRDLAGVPLGENGCNWVPFIKNRHFITDEYRHIRNRKYVKGCPELFNFGKSEYPKLCDLGDMIIATISNLSVAGQGGVADADRRFRNIVLLGHDLRSDLGYLDSMGVELWSVGGVMSRTLDTKDMHQAWRQETQGRSLGLVLTDLGIQHSNLHNAGNDAAYTIQAMIGLAVAARAKKDQKKLNMGGEEQSIDT